MANVLKDEHIDEIFDSFLSVFGRLIPEDRDIYLKKLLEEMKEIQEESKNMKNQVQQEMEDLGVFFEELNKIRENGADGATLTDDNYLETFIKEAKEAVSQKEFENAEQLKESVKDMIAKTQESHELDKTMSLPNQRPNNFEDHYNQLAEQFVHQNNKELTQMGVIYEEKDPSIQGKFVVYNEELIKSKEEVEKLKGQYLDIPNSQKFDFNPQFNMEEVRENTKKAKEATIDYSQTITSEIKESLGEDIKQAKENTNENTKAKEEARELVGVWDWFKQTEEEHKIKPITKDQYKEKFYNHCKNNMTQDEMKLLLRLSYKEPTKLTQEHKNMIQQGLKLALNNSNLLDKGLQTAIYARTSENTLINDNVQEFINSVDRMKQSNNLMDKVLLSAYNNIEQDIVRNTPNISQENKNALKELGETIIAIDLDKLREARENNTLKEFVQEHNQQTNKNEKIQSQQENTKITESKKDEKVNEQENQKTAPAPKKQVQMGRGR